MHISEENEIFKPENNTYIFIKRTFFCKKLYKLFLKTSFQCSYFILNESYLKVLLSIINILLEKYHPSKYFPLLLLPQLLLLSMAHHGVGHPFGQVGLAVSLSSCPGCVPSQALVHPQHPH